MIEISVYETHLDYNKKSACLRRRVDGHNFSVPFDSVVASLHCLFGNSCIIEFVVL